MKAKALSLTVLVVWAVGVTAALTGDVRADGANQLHDKESCYQTCGKTYSLHTYPKSQHLSVCQRGCRFSILTMVTLASKSSQVADPYAVAAKCLDYCSQAYDPKNKSSEFYACSIGCNSTITSKTTINSDNRPEVLSNEREREDDTSDSISDDNSDTTNQLFISPFHLLRSMFGSLMTKGSVVVERSSMSVYLSRSGDGESKLVVVQSEPEVVVHQYPDLMQGSEYDSETVTGAEERTTPDNHIQPKLDLSIWTQENPLETPKSRFVENSWSNCFSYQSGIPRWILASILLLAIFVLAWICCATTATAPEQHIRRKVGQGSDLKYLCLYEEPVKLVIDDKLPSYEELEAQKATNISSQTTCESNGIKS